MNFFDETLILLSCKYKVIVLPRDNNQVVHYSQEKFNQISVAHEVINFKNIASNCLLFVGAGGSMTRELAVLGVPTISIYQAEMLCVNKYLAAKGLMIIKPDITFDEIKIILEAGASSKIDFSVLGDGEISYRLIKSIILNLK